MYMKFHPRENHDTLDLTFSGGDDDEGSVATNSIMHASTDGDRGKQSHQSQMPLYSQLEGTESFVGTAEGSAGASAPPLPRPSHPS
ncbi:hypothetical protein Tco_0613539 [Tanacetum coccineum]